MRFVDVDLAFLLIEKRLNIGGRRLALGLSWCFLCGLD